MDPSETFRFDLPFRLRRADDVGDESIGESSQQRSSSKSTRGRKIEVASGSSISISPYSPSTRPSDGLEAVFISDMVSEAKDKAPDPGAISETRRNVRRRGFKAGTVRDLLHAGPSDSIETRPARCHQVFHQRHGSAQLRCRGLLANWT